MNESFISRNRLCLPPFNQSSKKSSNDPAQVLNIMKSTNFCEILSLLYGVLIHETDSNNNNHQTITENNSAITLHEKTFVIVINSMILLNTLAILDLDTFQVRLKMCENSMMLWISRRHSVKKQSHFNFDMWLIIFSLIVIINKRPWVIRFSVKLSFSLVIMLF